MKKIMIIGSPGSGKSTLATILASKLSLPVYHLDQYYWKPGWQEISKEELAHIQSQILKHDSWIIDGN